MDVFVALAMPRVLRGDAPLAVDLGFGAKPWTTLELAERWQRVDPTLRVLGIEIDAERVAEAASFAQPPAIDFRLGGFDLAQTLGGERARIVRAFNVLRQYDEQAVAEALDAIAGGMEHGGVLLEGTSTPSGGMMVFDVWRRTDTPVPATLRAASGGRRALLQHETLVFATNFREAVEPLEFRTVLPKRLIHRTLDPVPARFFDDWQRAWEMARPPAGSPRVRWLEAANTLRDQFGWPVDPRQRILRRGFLPVRGDLVEGISS